MLVALGRRQEALAAIDVAIARRLTPDGGTDRRLERRRELLAGGVEASIDDPLDATIIARWRLVAD